MSSTTRTASTTPVSDALALAIESLMTVAALIAADAPASSTPVVEPVVPLEGGAVLRRNAAGRLVDAKGKYVTETKAAPAKAKATRKPAAAKAKVTPEVPEFIVKRASNRSANADLAATLRKADIVPNGLAWELAKAGKSIRAIKAALKKQAAQA